MDARTRKYCASENGKRMRAAAQRRYAAAHPERVRQINAEQYAKNKQARIAAANEWTKANRDKTRAAVRKWEHANPQNGRLRHARRRAQEILAMPSWAEHDAIAKVYAEASQWGMTVDHIVPLQSRIVCGLHVHANLQLLNPSDNYAKRNWHWPDMP